MVLTGGISLVYRILRVGSSTERRAANELLQADPLKRPTHPKRELPALRSRSCGDYR